MWKLYVVYPFDNITAIAGNSYFKTIFTPFPWHNSLYHLQKPLHPFQLAFV